MRRIHWIFGGALLSLPLSDPAGSLISSLLMVFPLGTLPVYFLSLSVRFVLTAAFVELALHLYETRQGITGKRGRRISLMFVSLLTGMVATDLFSLVLFAVFDPIIPRRLAVLLLLGGVRSAMMACTVDFALRTWGGRTGQTADTL